MITLDDSDDYPPCPFALHLSSKEFDSLMWLLEVLEKISENPKSKNQQNATRATDALGKMRDHLADMHDANHLLEEKAANLTRELASHDLLTTIAKQSSTEGLN